jgi:hypothetical protein
VVLMNIWAFSCLYMGHFVHAYNGSCSCPPMGCDLGPNPARYIGPCQLDTKIFRVVPCLSRAFFPCFGPAHQTRPKCTPITGLTTYEAKELSPLFVLIGILLASLQRSLEALDYKRHFLLVESGSLHLSHFIW